MAEVSLPRFTQIDTTVFVERLEHLLNANLQKIDELLAKNTSFTWDNLLHPLEDMEDALEQLWSPLAHLHAVMNSKTLRECYQACLPKLSAYEAAIGHNEALYKAIHSVDKKSLNKTQKKIIEDTLQNFELSGVALSKKDKSRFEAIQRRLMELSNLFENNVLDAGQDYQLHITDANRLKGLPQHALDSASALAKEKNLSGWVLNLEIPCYLAVITYADDRALRQEIHKAYMTRASETGPSAGKFDNTAIMDEILALRHEKANLLGFKNYAELSLATKMADSADQVMQFLMDLTKRSHHQADEEFKRLQAFAKKEHDIEEVKPWDLAYLSEKKQQFRFAISQEELRPYFPLSKVMSGLFTIVKRLYGMTMEEVQGVDVWHKDVICYGIRDEENKVRGYIYADLFARPNKRGGAWMDSCRNRRKLSDGHIQLPVATLTCNFAKAAANKPPTLSHDEVLTLFHEFGHCLHHVLTQIDYFSAAGINGVEWDAVELPSQFFENWCWEEEALQLLTAHVDTEETLPKSLFDKMIAAKNFQSAMAMMRQVEFSIFDFRIHREYQAKPNFIADTLKEVRQHTTVVPIAPYNRFQHSFSHIFAGGYAAGYYSYKWAEVLSSDAFSRFEEEGIFNTKAGHDFLHKILELGGSRKALEAFVDFRGRPAKVDALLRHNGIQA
jgi:oligopeptidase A